MGGAACCGAGIINAKNQSVQPPKKHQKKTSINSEESLSSKSSSSSSGSSSSSDPNSSAVNKAPYIENSHTPMHIPGMESASMMTFGASDVSTLSNALFVNPHVSPSQSNTATIVINPSPYAEKKENMFDGNNNVPKITQAQSQPMVQSRVASRVTSKANHKHRHSTVLNTINNNITIQSKINISSNNLDNSFTNAPINIEKNTFNNNNNDVSKHLRVKSSTPKNVVSHELIDDKAVHSTHLRVSQIAKSVAKNDDDSKPPLLKGYSTLNEKHSDDEESSSMDEQERLEITKRKQIARNKSLKKKKGSIEPTEDDAIPESESDEGDSDIADDLAKKAEEAELGDISKELSANHGDLFRDQSSAHWTPAELKKKQREMAEAILALHTQNEDKDMRAMMQQMQGGMGMGGMGGMPMNNNNNNNNDAMQQEMKLQAMQAQMAQMQAQMEQQNNQNNDNKDETKKQGNSLEIPKK